MRSAIRWVWIPTKTSETLMPNVIVRAATEADYEASTKLDFTFT